MRGGRLRALARGALAASLASSLAIQGVNVVTGVLLARTLGPGDRGALAAVVLWPTLLAMAGSIGVFDAVVVRAARGTERPGRLVGSALALAAAEAVAVAAVAAVAVPAVLARFAPHAVSAGYLYLAYVPLALCTFAFLGVLNGRGRHTAFQRLRLAVPVVSAAGLVALRAAGHLTVTGAAVAYLVANAATLAAAAVLVLRETGVERPSRRIVRELFSFGLRSHLGNASSMLNERLDQLLVSVFLQPVALGLYVIAVTLTSLTSLVGSSVAFVSLPAVAAARDDAERRATARAFVGFTVLASTLVTVPVLVLAPWLVRLFFGEAFAGAVDVARILLVAAVVMSTNQALASVLTGAGRPLDQGAASLLGLVVTAAGLAALLPLLGILGAGVTSLVAYGVTLAWMVHRAKRALGLGSARLLLPSSEMARLRGTLASRSHP